MDVRKQFSSEYSELFRLAAIHYAELDGAALRLEKLSKRVFSSLVHHGEGSISAREHAARTDPKYTRVEDEWIAAQTAANVAKAEVEAIRIAFENYRTASASARAERGM